MEYAADTGKQVPEESRNGSQTLAQISLTDRIAATFERTPVTAGAEFVADVLVAMGHNRLVTGMHEIDAQLSELGFQVDVEYFARSESREPPLITMSVRDSNGDYLYPNINLRLNPAIPEQRFSGSSSQKHVITGDTLEPGADMRYLPALEMERFSPGAEIRFLIRESSSADMPYQLEPLFSKAAFAEARAHAAAACRDEIRSYSVIYHEQVIPQVAELLHQESAFYGERELPDIEDRGSDQHGAVLRLRSWTRSADGSSPVEFALVVEQEGLGVQIRTLRV